MATLRVRYLALFTALALALVLTSCSNTSSSPTPSSIDLQGLWTVTPGAGSTYGAGGTTTVEFGADSSGLATFLSQSTANGITTCVKQVYAALSDKVILLDGTYYQASTPTSDRIVLDDGAATVTLDRVTGSPPVAPCSQGTATVVATLPDPVNSRGTLNAVGSKLYYNVDDSAGTIIAYDTATSTIGAGRVYSTSVAGGTHRYVVAGRTDDLFYGQCYCGGSNTLDYFNLATNTSNANVDTDAGLGVAIGIRYGYYTGSSVIIGGRLSSDYTKNQLLTLDQNTLSLTSQRQILPEAAVTDITMRGSDLLALVGDSIVVVGSSGNATATYTLSGAALYLYGIATVGTSVYAIGTTASGDGVLYRLTLP